MSNGTHKHKFIHWPYDPEPTDGQIIKYDETEDHFTPLNDDSIHDNVSGEINAITEKTDIHNNDLVVIEDSEDSYSKKKSKISSILNNSSGGDAHYIESNNQNSTTSTNWQQKARLTFTPVSQGNYEISFSALISHEDTGVFYKSRIQIDDTDTYKEVHKEFYNFKYGDGAWHVRTGKFVVNLTATEHNIDLDYCTGDSGKAAYIKEVIIIAKRI